jgi:23S rRNA (pseudouridine1915-N3)-methyltransferase
MLKLTLLSVGRFGRGPERDLYDTYVKRLTWPLDLQEVEARKAGSDAERNALENRLLRERSASAQAIVALDETGELLDSRGFAARLQDLADDGRRDIAILIGGADGLERETRKTADLTLSLGRLTWPHLMVRAMLAEQLYRAQTILSGHPYHRD